jgi:zinc transporter ZupT
MYLVMLGNQLEMLQKTGLVIDEYQHQQLSQEVNAYRLAMMIAIGIGFHNFSEGLAICQSYASGAI